MEFLVDDSGDVRTSQASHDEAGTLNAVLARWKAAVDAHQPAHVAALFTTDAIFQGLHPYTVGRAGVAEYYAAQPPGLTATYTLLETRTLGDGMVLGYLTVDFGFTGPRHPSTVYLSVITRREADGWRIAHYQVSRLGWRTLLASAAGLGVVVCCRGLHTTRRGHAGAVGGLGATRRAHDHGWRSARRTGHASRSPQG